MPAHIGCLRIRRRDQLGGTPPVPTCLDQAGRFVDTRLCYFGYFCYHLRPAVAGQPAVADSRDRVLATTELLLPQTPFGE